MGPAWDREPLNPAPVLHPLLRRAVLFGPKKIPAYGWDLALASRSGGPRNRTWRCGFGDRRVTDTPVPLASGHCTNGRGRRCVTPPGGGRAPGDPRRGARRRRAGAARSGSGAPRSRMPRSSLATLRRACSMTSRRRLPLMRLKPISARSLLGGLEDQDARPGLARACAPRDRGGGPRRCA